MKRKRVGYLAMADIQDYPIGYVLEVEVPTRLGYFDLCKVVSLNEGITSKKILCNLANSYIISGDFRAFELIKKSLVQKSEWKIGDIVQYKMGNIFYKDAFIFTWRIARIREVGIDVVHLEFPNQRGFSVEVHYGMIRRDNLPHLHKRCYDSCIELMLAWKKTGLQKDLGPYITRHFLWSSRDSLVWK